jgi:drug/metabolite transporter (DMT)-like permease
VSGPAPVPAVLAPLAAAVCYGVAAVVQQIGARRAVDPVGDRPDPRPGPHGAPDPGRFGPGLLLGLVRQPLFLLGLGLDAVGFALAFVGLRHLPVFVVEAGVASTVAVTALLGRRYAADPLGRRHWALVGAVVLGLAVVGSSAAPGGRPEVGPPGRLLLVSGVPGLALAALALDRRRPTRRPGAGHPAGADRDVADRRSAAALGALSGVGFGAFALAARVVPTHHGARGLAADPVLWAAVAYAVLGLAIYGTALARGSVTAVTAAAIATEALLPSAVGLLVLSDRTRPGLAGVAVAGFAHTGPPPQAQAQTQNAPER